jgi:hypothetical protein
MSPEIGHFSDIRSVPIHVLFSSFGGNSGHQARDIPKNPMCAEGVAEVDERGQVNE